jgi:hypothetical protein
MFYKIKSKLSVHAQLAFKFLGYFMKGKNNYKKFCLLLCKQLLILKIVPKATSEFRFRLSYAVIGQNPNHRRLSEDF